MAVTDVVLAYQVVGVGEYAAAQAAGAATVDQRAAAVRRNSKRPVSLRGRWPVVFPGHIRFIETLRRRK